jgi:hypothetical protein
MKGIQAEKEITVVSGGSYQFLYRQNELAELSPLLEMQETLARVAPDSAGLAALNELVRTLKSADEQFDLLRDVLHAVEWLESSDYLEEEVRKVAVKWTATGPGKAWPRRSDPE